MPALIHNKNIKKRVDLGINTYNEIICKKGNKTMKKGKIFNVLFIIILIILSMIMLYFIDKKEGFHEDEIFSYGSSNYKYDNLFQAAAHMDSRNRAIEKYIMADTIGQTIKNIIYYSKNSEEYGNLIYEIMISDKPIWKTPEDAKNYLSVTSDEIFSFGSIYYNQARDVHPPLFYFLVHIVSVLFLNNFSKYIIFLINLVFFIGICIFIRKILKLYDKEKLSIQAIILYGASIGGISTVIFQRMYAMLAFFCVLYLYLTLKIIKNEYVLDKKLKIQLVLTTIFGFLTQYYFCIYAVFVFIIIFIKMLMDKKNKEAITYLIQHIKAALIGVVFFPPSIYHIFFSYRGIGNKIVLKKYIYKIVYYIKEILNAYSLASIIGYIIAIGMIITIIILLIKNRKKIKFKFESLLLLIPIILFILVIAKISPTVNEKYTIRYVTAILPIISVFIIFIIDNLINNKKISLTILTIFTIIISIYGLTVNNPKYLYKGYSEYMDIAEKYKDLNFLYVCDNGFTHINSLPEFMIYNKSMIINLSHDKLDFLITDEEFQKQNEYILSIKKWMNTDEVLNKILEKTGFTKYEVLLDDNSDTQSKIYLIKR